MISLDIQENFRLAPLTTLGVGGAARFFVEGKSETDICAAVEWAKTQNLLLFVLGGGSNIVVSDRGFDGLVLRIANRGIEISPQDSEVLVTAQAGEDWDELVCFCVERDFAGIECLSGIPGSCGGTPVQNVGAYGQEVSQTIQTVRVLERASGKVFDLTNADCRFAYRTSIFNTTERDRFIVLSVVFRLQIGGEPAVRYKDLQEFFGNRKPSLRETRKVVLEIRRAKSMVLDANDPNSRSAGSFFKNPVVEKAEFERITDIAEKINLIDKSSEPPHFPAGENKVKIPAAWLIEKSGFRKGYTKNNRVGISENHTLAIVNRGEASAEDVLSFAREIQNRVAELFGVKLEPEPIFVGF